MGMFLRRGSAKKGTPIGTLEVGSIIKLNESGTPIEFYVAKHDYEPELNGSGRTLIVRKDCYDSRAFNASDNAFDGSDIDVWLNNTWLQLLDADVKSAVNKTTFYYTPGAGTYKVTTLQRAVFLLSVTELGLSATYANAEGSALDIAGTLQIAYADGSASTQWTRTPYRNDGNTTFYVRGTGALGNASSSRKNGSRPVFTLPSDFTVTDDMLA